MTGSGLLTGRIAVVTGGARGIGRAVAQRLAEEGAAVAIADVDGDGARRSADEVHSATGASTVGVAVDVADPDSVRAAVEQVGARLGVCDVIVPNAGILVLRPALDIAPEEFARLLRINLDGAFLTATEFARPLLAAGRGGSIVFSASLFGLRGGAGNAAYAASKFGLVGLAQSLAADLAPNGVRVNTVCPGQIQSDMIDQLFRDRAEASGRSPAEERASFAARIPLGRLGTAAEVADAYVYLASDLSAYVTGHSLVVDGGWMVS